MGPIDVSAVRVLQRRPETFFTWRESASPVAIPRPVGSETASELVRIQSAAVLFADIVAFTRLAEGWSPGNTIDFLRRYQRRMAAEVFLKGGSVAQYSGDSIMAAFGAPDLTPRSASNALSCAFGMLEAIASWNAKRCARGRFPIQIGIGVHFGTVGIGSIGTDRHLEQAIVGDTVNVARKLEALTRKMGAALIASGDLLDAVSCERRGFRSVERLVPCGARTIPGRAGPIAVWVLPRG
jgi:adenylate cyclase